LVVTKLVVYLYKKIKQIENMTTITETKRFKIEFNGSKTYFITDDTGQVWFSTYTLKKATNRLNKILTQSGLN